MAGKDKATEVETPVEATPADETKEEFDEAFEEFAAEDEPAAPAPGQEVLESEPEPEPEPEPAAPGEESPDDATPEAAPEGAAVDIWADATTEQKAAFEAAQQTNRSNKGRLSAQDRKIIQLTTAPAPAAPAAEPAAEETSEEKEEWETFKTEYPEVAGPVEKRYGAEISALKTENANLRGQVTGITDNQLQDAINDQEAVLADRHPDWEKLTKTPEFSAWLPNQPRYVQEGFVRNGTAIVDGQEAASLIDLFRPPPVGAAAAAETEPSGKAKRRQRRLESAVTTESGQAGPGAGPAEGDFDAAFDHFAALP